MAWWRRGGDDVVPIVLRKGTLGQVRVFARRADLDQALVEQIRMLSGMLSESQRAHRRERAKRVGRYRPRLGAHRRFVLNRNRDATGVSGTGVVAEGVQFLNGRVVIAWQGKNRVHSISSFDTISQVQRIHGHEGDTIIEWLDPDPRDEVPPAEESQPDLYAGLGRP